MTGLPAFQCSIDDDRRENKLSPRPYFFARWNLKNKVNNHHFSYYRSTRKFVRRPIYDLCSAFETLMVERSRLIVAFYLTVGA